MPEQRFQIFCFILLFVFGFRNRIAAEHVVGPKCPESMNSIASLFVVRFAYPDNHNLYLLSSIGLMNVWMP